MKLIDLLKNISSNEYEIIGQHEIKVSCITWDYQKVIPGALYFAFEEEEFQEAHISENSLHHIQDAIEKGATVIVVPFEKKHIWKARGKESFLYLDNYHLNMSGIAKRFYSNPFERMTLVGITGTNGKTTTSQFLDSMLNSLGRNTGVIGTIGTLFKDQRLPPGTLSTPLAADLFQSGDMMRNANIDTLTMEVTSHAMHFERTVDLDYDVAVFTNLTQDHLDFHKNFEEYKKSKLKHFARLGAGEKDSAGVVNIDDPNGFEFINAIPQKLKKEGKVKVYTYGIVNKNSDFTAYPKELNDSECRFELFFQGESWGEVIIPTPGIFNIYNSLACIASCYALGEKKTDILNVVSKIKNIEGRFEKVINDLDLSIFIDYAHTPDSLEKSLESLRSLTKKRLFVVFGCGGNRDKKKRPLMGDVAQRLADEVFLTNDNPRREAPNEIITDILSGIDDKNMAKVSIVEDRAEAIKKAICRLTPGDSLLVAGKGHEKYQIIGEQKINFSDHAVTLSILDELQIKRSRLWLEISEQNVRKNWDLINEDKSRDLKVLFVAKDNALGHGMVEMSEIALEKGACYLAVATLGEAIILRENLISAPILILGERQISELKKCLELSLTVQVQSDLVSKQLNEFAKERELTCKVHVKVDTGMGRYGVHHDKAVKFIEDLSQYSNLEVEGVMTHFAQSDEEKKDYANEQWKKFDSVLEQLKEKRILPKYIHACNTGGYLDLPHAHGNMIRTGVLPTGVYPSKVCRRIRIEGKELSSAMILKTKIAFVKTLFPGEFVGYGMHFKAEKEMVIGVLPFGYGDGYPRVRNKGEVIVRDQKIPIIGGNAMDATMVDLTRIMKPQAGEDVVVLGKSMTQEITARDIAEWGNTVMYDVMSRWSSRVDRVYL